VTEQFRQPFTTTSINSWQKYVMPFQALLTCVSSASQTFKQARYFVFHTLFPIVVHAGKLIWLCQVRNDLLRKPIEVTGQSFINAGFIKFSAEPFMLAL